MSPMLHCEPRSINSDGRSPADVVGSCLVRTPRINERSRVAGRTGERRLSAAAGSALPEVLETFHRLSICTPLPMLARALLRRCLLHTANPRIDAPILA